MFNVITKIQEIYLKKKYKHFPWRTVDKVYASIIERLNQSMDPIGNSYCENKIITPRYDNFKFILVTEIDKLLSNPFLNQEIINIFNGIKEDLRPTPNGPVWAVYTDYTNSLDSKKKLIQLINIFLDYLIYLYFSEQSKYKLTNSTIDITNDVILRSFKNISFIVLSKSRLNYQIPIYQLGLSIQKPNGNLYYKNFIMGYVYAPKCVIISKQFTRKYK